MNNAMQFIGTFTSAFIAGALFTIAFSAYGTEYEAFSGISTIFGIGATAIPVSIVTAVDFEEDTYKYMSANRWFCLVCGIIGAVAPYLLWVNEIVTF